jgi:hypothetical protein
MFRFFKISYLPKAVSFLILVLTGLGFVILCDDEVCDL